jgi:UDP-sugar transporter A1/2/3
MLLCTTVDILLLVALVVIENSNVLLTRFTRSGGNPQDYFGIGDMMLITEISKVVLAMILELWETKGNLQHTWVHLDFTSVETHKVGIPAFLYFVQNSLFYVALSNLSSPVFQVLYQLKLLTTAVISVWLLKRKYMSIQWISLCTLTFGAILAVLARDTDATPVESKQNSVIGFLAVLVACFCSAFAGVSFEKLLKKDPPSSIGELKVTKSPSLWMRNVQLGLYSVFFGTIQFMYSTLFQSTTTVQKPFLANFTIYVWVLVLLRASCGILVAVIIKNMDNVIKSIASSISVLAGCIMSEILFGTVLQGSFWFGAIVVVASSYVFSRPPKDVNLYTRLEEVSVKGFKGANMRMIAVALLLTVSGLIGSFALLPEGLGFDLSNRNLPSAVPADYKERLHFIVRTWSDFNPASDCGGCNVLWELHFALKAQNYSTTTTIDGVPPNRTVVVIYPEVSYERWQIADIHVRWILAEVGINIASSVTESWNHDDIVSNYATSTGKNVPVSNVLQVVNTPSKGDATDISDELFYSKNRTGIAWMMRKGPRYHTNITYIHNQPGYESFHVDGAVTVDGLRKYEYFVSYDPYTYWTWFAAMQGTVSVVYPLHNVTKSEWAMGTFLGSYMQDQGITEIPGVAYGWEPEEIEYAKRTMHQLRPFLLALRRWGGHVTVPRFARDCYRYSQGERTRFEGAMLVKDVYRKYYNASEHTTMLP